MGMRKKDLRVVGKPLAELNCVLPDPPIPPKPQSSPEAPVSIVSRFIALRDRTVHRTDSVLRSRSGMAK